MAQEPGNAPYVLGLDLGVQSVGWAVLDSDKQGNVHAVRDMGARCFDSGVGSEKEIEMGTDESSSAKRRDARQYRRQLWRRARRHAAVFRILQQAGLLPAGPVRTPEERHELLLMLDAELAAEENDPGDRIAGHVLPYRLRAKALDEPLSHHALGRALYHLAQRRGFLSNKKAKKDSDEEGVVKEGIAELQKEMSAADARTLGEYFAGLDPEEHRIRGRWTARKMFTDEFEKIWSAQAKHHEVLTDELKVGLYNALFKQRPLKSQKGLIGKCELERGQRRAPMAALDAQRFRYWQKITDLEITAPDGEILKLTPEQRETLAEAFEARPEIKFAGIRKVLGLKKPKGAEHNYEFNLEAGGEKKILGNRTAAKFIKVLGDRWTERTEEDRELLVQEVLAFEKEDALQRRLVKAWRFDDETAKHLAAIDLEPGYCALSRRAIRKLLPRMQNGVHLNTARKELYGEQLAEKQTCDTLPPVLDAVKHLRNPVVCRALTEMRKVVNALIHKYGKPAMIRVEMARDMKKGSERREKDWKRMRKNEKLREDAKKRILEEAGIQEPRGGDILKVRLAEECNWECPYTGRTIEMALLVGSNPQFDIEHILPFSRSLDNSYINKTLCYHKENRDVKRNRTPYEAYRGHEDKWQEICRRVARFKGDARQVKLKRFQMEKIPEDFVARQLNDTRYMSRLAADYVGMLFGGRVDADGKLRVQVSAGRVTAYLRDQWGLNAVLGDGPNKERGDHRHHAVDAVAIALTTPATVELLSQAAEEAENRGNRLFVPIDPPWDDFVDEARRSVDDVNISFRVNRRVSGALHEETLYSKPYPARDKNGKEVEYRHVRKPLQNMSTQEIDEIVDDKIRSLVREKLDQLGGNPKKAFADVSNHPYLEAADERIVPIHKARIRKNVATITMGQGGGSRHVASGKNHHMEIVAVLDANGNEKKWKGCLVSLHEATQRLHRGEPVIKHDHGEGKRFKFSLAGGEYVEMEHEAQKPQLYRVVGISSKVIEFRLHTDARPSTILRKIPRARITRSPSKLLVAKARKVTVDPLGNIFPAND